MALDTVAALLDMGRVVVDMDNYSRGKADTDMGKDLDMARNMALGCNHKEVRLQLVLASPGLGLELWDRGVELLKGSVVAVSQKVGWCLTAEGSVAA